MNIELATDKDYDVIRGRDRHLPERLVRQKIDNREIYMLRDTDGTTIGWMRYGYFWDNTPFMHFYRKLGYKDAGCLLLPSEPLEMIMITPI